MISVVLSTLTISGLVLVSGPPLILVIYRILAIEEDLYHELYRFSIRLSMVGAAIYFLTVVINSSILVVSPFSFTLGHFNLIAVPMYAFLFLKY